MSSSSKKPNDADMLELESEVTPPAENTVRPYGAVSAVRDEPYDRDEPHAAPVAQNSRPDVSPTSAPENTPQGPATSNAGLPPAERKKNIIPGGLAFEQLHLPPAERKPLTYEQQTFKNIVEYGSLNDPNKPEPNTWADIPSLRATLERSKAERQARLEREAEEEKAAEEKSQI